MKLRNIFLGFLFLILIVLSAVGCSYHDISHFPFSKNSVVNSELSKWVRNELEFHSCTIMLIGEWNSPLFITERIFRSDKNTNIKINSGVKTLSGKELEPFSIRFFVSPLLLPLNCDDLSKEIENWVSDLSPEIFSTMVSSLY